MVYTRPEIESGKTRLNKQFFDNLLDGVDEKLSTEVADATYERSRPVGLSDFANSWWCVKRSQYSALRNCIHQGGVDAQGTISIGVMDLRRRVGDRVKLGTFEVDDHNVSAFLLEESKPPVVAYAQHAVKNVVNFRVGTTRMDIDTLGAEQELVFPGACTYVHIFWRTGTDTAAIATRNEDGWYVRVTRDWFKTFEPAFRLHGIEYATFNIFDGVAHYVATTHPVTSVNNGIWKMRISLATGVITNEAGTIIDNLWNFSGTVITKTAMTYVRQSYDVDIGHNSNRVFDALPDGSVLAMQMDKAHPELGGMYGVYRRATTGATPSAGQSPDAPQRGWVFEPIVASGIPVGYYQSAYVGGMTAGANKDEVYLAREASGTWTFERWTKTGSVWSLVEILLTRTDGTKLGRPQVPWGAYGTGLFTGLEYFRYPTANFGGYYSDQIVLETATRSVVPTPDTTPPGLPTALVSVAGGDYADLSWAAASGTPLAYDIYNGSTRLATVTGLTHRVPTLNPGQAYVFSARAVDAAGNQSAAVNFPSVTPTTPPTRDPILVDNGSLVLVDPTNTFGAWAAGVPAHGAAVTNLAPGGSAVTVANTLTATDGIIERTTKGGLHGIVSQATGAASRAYNLTSSALRDYLAANPTHAFYISAWVSVTRLTAEATPTPQGRMVGFLTAGYSDIQGIRLVTGNKLSAAPSTNRTGITESAIPVPVGQAHLIKAAHSAINTAGSTTFTQMGHHNAVAANLNPSWILYRLYMEDLTVSGRTYAEVGAIDQSLYTAAFGAGGRYNGDTHTAVTTLP